MIFSTKNLPKNFLLALILTMLLIVSINMPQSNAQTSASITINNGATYTNSTLVNLTLSATNATLMSFSNDNSTWSTWEAYNTAENWTLPTGDNAYTVYVKFQDSNNITAYNSANIILDQTPPNPSPYAGYYSLDYKTVAFDASYSTDNNGIQSYTWNFGDGNITTGISLLHTYAAIGNYTVTLTVQDLANNTASANLTVPIPDISTLATATPIPTITPQPTTYPTITPQPTIAPTAPSATLLDSLTGVILIGAAVIIVIIILTIFVFRKKPKSQEKAPEQQETINSSPPPENPENS
jgi:PKD repeat protein